MGKINKLLEGNSELEELGRLYIRAIGLIEVESFRKGIEFGLDFLKEVKK